MVKVLLLTCTLCTIVLAVACAGSRSASPPASTDCMDSLLGLTDCLTYVENGSTVAKPDSGCCSGLKTVLKDSAACLCDAFKNCNDYGISLNVTKAMNLPAACGISSNALSQCEVSGVPPTATPTRSPAPANVPKPSHHHSRPVPAPAPTSVTLSPSVTPVAPAMPPSTSPGTGNVFKAPALAPLESGSRASTKVFSALLAFFATFAVAVISLF